MKINIIRGILIILLLLNFMTIFGFSNQSGEESSGISKTITEQITRNMKSVQQKPKEEKEIALKRIEKIIRKIAHFSIYTSVGILLMTLFSTYKLNNRKRAISSLLIGVVYAISDELHQLFSEGRSAQITDVVLDGMGVLFGCLLVILIIKLYQDMKQKNIIKTNY